MSFALALDAYFTRIGYDGPVRPDVETLNAIIGAHVRSIPFENLDVLLGRPIHLDPERIAKKLVIERRGGYCFEQNSLLMDVLTALGFEVRPLAARVRFQRPREFVAPRTHLFLRVEIDGQSWLADVGVGGLSPTSALRLVADEPQETPHEPRRIVRVGAWSGFELRAPDARLYHQVYFGNEWHDVCEFTLEEMPLTDRLIANWFTSAHPDSHFRNRLVVARATAEGRLTLSNRELGVRRRDGTQAKRLASSPDELLELLAEQFGLHFPAGTRFACAELDFTTG